MQRVRLDIQTLYRYVAVVGVAVTCLLTVWTILDAPGEVYEYSLTTEVIDNGETVVAARNYCGWKSGEIFWFYVGLGWRAALLLPGGMVAFLSSQVKEDRHDSRSVGVALSIHLVVLMLQVVAFGMQQEDRANNIAYQSLFSSADTLVGLALYILPKFWHTGEDLDDEPLPDVFVHTTIALIDVEGFTAWQSVREPVHVFKFLEKL